MSLTQLPAIHPEESNSSRSRFLQSDNFPHQGRLAAPVSAGNGEHLTSVHRQTHILVHDGITKPGRDMTHFDDRL